MTETEDRPENNTMGEVKEHRNVKDRYALWPAAIVLILMLMNWYCIYGNEGGYVLSLLSSVLLSFFYTILAVFLFLRRRHRMAVSLVVGVHVLVLVVLFPVRLGIYAHSRYYVEFLIQKTWYHPEMNDPGSLPDYKEWTLDKRNHDGFAIVYDRHDGVAKKAGAVKGSCDSAYKVGEHFYVVTTLCSGFP